MDAFIYASSLHLLITDGICLSHKVGEGGGGYFFPGFRGEKSSLERGGSTNSTHGVTSLIVHEEKN